MSFYDLFSICLRAIDHLILKLWVFSGHTASFKIEILKVQDFGDFELSPMHMQQVPNSSVLTHIVNKPN